MLILKPGERKDWRDICKYSLLVSQVSTQFTMINLSCIKWVTNVFYMQIENQLWTGKLMVVNKETPLVEDLLPHLPATPEETWLCHLDPKVCVVHRLLTIGGCFILICD